MTHDMIHWQLSVHSEQLHNNGQRGRLSTSNLHLSAMSQSRKTRSRVAKYDRDTHYIRHVASVHYSYTSTQEKLGVSGTSGDIGPDLWSAVTAEAVSAHARCGHSGCIWGPRSVCGQLATQPHQNRLPLQPSIPRLLCCSPGHQSCHHSPVPGTSTDSSSPEYKHKIIRRNAQ